MNKKIYALLLLVFVLVTLSAVSAADVQDNNQTLALDSSSDIVAVSNDDSNALKLSNDDEIQQISDSDEDVLGAGSGISITSCPSTMDYGNPYEKLNFEIFIVGPDGINYGEIPSAKVWLNVDGERIASTTSDEDSGAGSFSLSSLPSGTHIVKCEYDGSDYYDASESATKTITVNGGDTPVEKTTVYLDNYDGVPSITMNYGDSITYTAAVYSDEYYGNPLSDVPLKLTAGSNTVRATSNANGEATFDLSGITPGTYTATIDVDSDDYEADATFTIGLTVNGDAPEKTTVYLYDDAHPSSMTEGDSESLSVTVENVDTGAYQGGVTLKVTIDKDYSITTANGGFASLDLSEVPAGTYTVRIVVDDANYESSDVITYDLTVNPGVKTELDITSIDSPSSMTEGDSEVFSIGFMDMGTGSPVSGVRVKVTVDKDYYITTGSDGVATLDLSGVPADTYTIKAVVDSTKYYWDGSISRPLTVNPGVKTELDITSIDSPSSMTEGDSEVFSIGFMDMGTGSPVSGVRVKVTVDKDYYITTGSDGVATLDLSGVPADTYTIKAVVDSTKYYWDGSISRPLTVNSADPVVKTKVYLEDGGHPNEPIAEGDNEQITAYVADDIANLPGIRVKATIDKDYYAVSDNNGMVSFDLSGVPAGEYNVVLVVDDDNYTSDALEYDLTVTGETEVNIHCSNAESERVITVGANEIQAYNVLDKDTMEVGGVNVKVTIGDIVMNSATNEQGFVDFDLSTIPVGTYDIIAVVDQEGYKSNTVTIPLTVNKVESYLTVDRFGDENVLEIKLGDKVVLNASLVDFNTNDPISGATVVFIIDGTDYTNVTDENGKVSYTVSGLTIGNHTVNYRFDGSENYTANTGLSNINDIISVSKKDYMFFNPSDDIVYGDKVQFILRETMTKPLTGTFTIKSDIYNGTLNVNNGIGVIDQIFDVGNYTFTITSEEYADKEGKATIVPAGTETTLNGKNDTKVGSEESLTAQVNVTSGQVAFYVNDVLNQTVDLNGENVATFDLSALPAGNYTITANYSDSKGNYKESSASMNVTVSKYDIEITVNPKSLDLKVGNNSSVTATLNETDAKGDVTFVSSDESVVTVENGVVTAKAEGEVNITVSYAGDDKYNAAEDVTVSVKVSKIDTEITVANETVSLKVESEIDSGASLDPVDAGDLTYKSDNESVVKVVDGKLVAVGEGTATVNVSFDGNEKYNKAESKTIQVTVSLNDATVSAEDITLDVDANKTINVITNPNGLNVTYTPDNSGVVTVDDNGLVTGLKGGSANVTITIVGNGKYYENSTTITVTVNKLDATISVSDKVEMNVGDSVNLNATLTPADAGNLTYYSLSSFVEIDENGTIVAISEGNASVVVAFNGNEKYNPVNAKVITVTVKKIDTTISVNDKVDMKVGDSVDANAKLTPADAGTLNYNSNNPSVVKVENGKLVAVGKGTATVTVSYDGDDKYNAAESKTITVTVKKIDTSIEVDKKSLDLKVDDKDAVVASLTPADAGKVTFTSSDESVVTVDKNGKVTAVGAGSATVTASYAGSDKYNAAKDVTVAVTVKKIDTSIEVNEKSLDLKVGDDSTVTANLTPADAGNVVFTSSDESVVTVDKNGKVTAVGAGSATVTVSYGGDDKYNVAESKTITVTVKKIDTSIEVDEKSLDLKVGDDSSVAAKLTPADAGNVVFTSSDESVVTVDANGKVKAVGAGSATVTASYAGSDKYNAAKNVTVAVTVKKIDTSIEVNEKSLDLKVGDDSSVTANLTPADAGNVVFTSSDESVVTVDKNGKVTAVGAGSATVTVSFAGNDKYNAAKDVTVAVSVKKIDTSIEVDKKSLDLKVDDKDAVVASLTPADAGKVTFTSSDESVVTVDKNGKVTAVGAGSATITASYAGSDKYNSAENVTVAVSVKENKQNASMDVDAGKAVEDENSTIAVNLPKDATGDVTAVIEGNPYTAPVVNGTATIAVPGLRPGNYTAHVTYSGDDKYKPASKDIAYEVEEVDKSDIISAPDVTKYFGGSERFVVNITDYKGNPVANKSVTIEINGQSYGRTTKADGTTSIGLALNSGVFNVTVTVGNETLNAVVTVLPTVNGTDVVKVYRNATPYYATFRDSEGNYLKEGTVVTFNINGVMYERKISGSEGLAKLNLNLEQGTYVLTAMNPQTGENAANNITIIPRLVENKDITKYYRNATQYTVKVLGDDGNPVGAGETVTFNINGVMYNRQTNESGIAKLNLNLQPDDYIITAEYKNCKVSNKIKILPVLSAKDISMKYRDGTKFVATLVDGQGKPFAGQTIQFNINGVFYNRVTDSSGQAKLNINLQAGQYIITSSYNGANLANTVTIAA